MERPPQGDLFDNDPKKEGPPTAEQLAEEACVLLGDDVSWVPVEVVMAVCNKYKNKGVPVPLETFQRAVQLTYENSILPKIVAPLVKIAIQRYGELCGRGVKKRKAYVQALDDAVAAFGQQGRILTVLRKYIEEEWKKQRQGGAKKRPSRKKRSQGPQEKESPAEQRVTEGEEPADAREEEAIKAMLERGGDYDNITDEPLPGNPAGDPNE